MSAAATAQEPWFSVPVSGDAGRFVEDAGWVKPPVSDGNRAVLLKERGCELSVVDLAPASGRIDPAGRVFPAPFSSSVPLVFGGDMFLVGKTAGKEHEIVIQKPDGTIVALSPGPNYFYAQAVATENVALVLWYEASSCEGRTCYALRFILIDPSLEVIAGPTLLGTSAIDPRSDYALSPCAIPIPEGFAVTWRGSEPGEASLAILNESGTILSETALHSDRMDGGIALASDGTRLLLMWISGEEIVTSTFSLDGDRLTSESRPFPTVGAKGTPAVIWAGTTYGVAWSEEVGPPPCVSSPVASALRVGHLSPDGGPAGRPLRVVNGSWNDTPYFVSVRDVPILIWRAGSCDGNTRMDRWLAASPPGGSPTIVSGFYEIPSQTSPAVASDGYHVLVAWEQETGSESHGIPRVFVISVTPAGHRTFEMEPVSPIENGTQIDPVISFDGVRFLVTWIQQEGNRRTILARFIHPIDGPEGRAITIANLHQVVQDEYFNQLNQTFLDSTYVDGAHHLFWLDGAWVSANFHLMTADVLTSGLATGTRGLGGPWDHAGGIDATATPAGILVTWSTRSGWWHPQVHAGTYGRDLASRVVYDCPSSAENISNPRILPVGSGDFLVTWRYDSGHDPYLSLKATNSSGVPPIRLTESCYCPLSYDVMPDGDDARLYWTREGQLYSSTIDADLARSEPVPLFPTEEIAVAPHSQGVVLATTVLVAGQSRLFVRFPQGPEIPRRRGVRR